MLAANQLNPPSDQREAIEGRHPGIGEKVEACARLGMPGEPGGMIDEAKTTLTLPDGRELTVVDSTNVEITGTGYKFVLNGKTVIYEGGKVTVDGAEVEVPAFATALEIKVENGEVVLTGS